MEKGMFERAVSRRPDSPADIQDRLNRRQAQRLAVGGLLVALSIGLVRRLSSRFLRF